jgi:REP element-mobilizing transposase RayT
MARVARRDGIGVCHHVLLRGIERRAIFHDDVDREDFVSRLRRQLSEGRGRCLAWVLMTNHVHLVLRTGERPLSNVMRRLNGGYARAFNLRHGRSGYLFQDRFRSIVVQDDAYLRVLIRYVLRNPLKAGMVTSLEELAAYRWGGYAELMRGAGTELLARDELLGLFGARSAEARRALVSWMHAGELSAHEDSYLLAEGSRSGARFDGGAPIRWEPSGLPDPTLPEIRARRLRSAGWTLDALFGWVCARLCADPSAVRAGRRTFRESRARAVIGALATRELRLSLACVAGATGVTPGPLCRAIERGARIMEEHGIHLDEGGPPREAIRQLRFRSGRSVIQPSPGARPRARAASRARRGAGGRARRGGTRSGDRRRP